MSELILPPQYQRRNVRMTENLAVLRHSKTKRILCFCYADLFARTFEAQGYEVIPINYAHEYDKFAQQLREQTAIENAAEDLAVLEREDVVRQRLRNELRQKLREATTGTARQVIESALHTLDVMQERKKRIRKESFMVQEAKEADASGKVDGVDIVKKIICNE